jgi:hypothetical protein
MTFKNIIEVISYGAVAIALLSLWMTVLLSTIVSITINKWFNEREAYIKRMSIIPTDKEHEYETSSLN